jgi:hypothetical protein
MSPARLFHRASAALYADVDRSCEIAAGPLLLSDMRGGKAPISWAIRFLRRI